MRFKGYEKPWLLAAAWVLACQSEPLLPAEDPSHSIQEPKVRDADSSPPTHSEPERPMPKNSPPPIEAEEPKPASVSDEPFLADEPGLKVLSLVLGNGVEKTPTRKIPLHPGTDFDGEDTDKIIAFITVENPESLETELAVSFLAPDGETERGKVQVSIPARPKWATRAFYKIRGPTGQWTVIIRHGDRIIAKAPFRFTM